MKSVMDGTEQELLKLEACRELVDQYTRAMDSPAWQNTISPMLQEQRTQRINQLVSACVEGKPGDTLRALGSQVATLDWALTNMSIHNEKYFNDLTELHNQLEAEQQVDADIHSVLESGRSNPYADPSDDPTNYTEPLND